MPYEFKLPFHLERDNFIHNSSIPGTLQFVALPSKEWIRNMFLKYAVVRQIFDDSALYKLTTSRDMVKNGSSVQLVRKLKVFIVCVCVVWKMGGICIICYCVIPKGKIPRHW